MPHARRSLLTTLLIAAAIAALPAAASANGSPTIVSVESGYSHTCSLISDGKVKCWGSNSSGQLGNGTTTSSATPVEVSGITDAIDLAVGENSACAVLSGGSIKCWGSNSNTQLGNGGTCSPGFMGSPPSGDCQRSTPVSVSGITTATQVTVAKVHACARLSDGTAKCWGDGGSTGNALGNGPTLTAKTPVSVFQNSTFPYTSLANVVELAAGSSHTCARLTTGAVRCWGWNSQGQLGTGNTTSLSYATTAATGVSGATAIEAARDGNSSCAVVTDGKVRCWGNNGASVGFLGTGSTVNEITAPSLVKGSDGNDVTGATSMSIYGSTICAVKSTGALLCWGLNGYVGYGPGRLDTGTALTFKTASGFISYSYLDAAAAITSAGSVRAVGLGANGATNCVVTDTGATVKCWPNATGDLLQEVAGVLSSPPPATPVLSGAPASLTNQTSASISFSSVGATSYRCSVDGESYSDCTSPKSLSGLADGAHSLAVKAVNGGGESEAATANWTVDATPPARPVLLGVPPVTTARTEATISFTGDAGVTFSCSVDGGPFSTCTSPNTRTGLALGVHSLAVKATDAAGNVGETATGTWTVQVPLNPPSTPTSAPAKTVVYSSATKRWTMKLGLIFTTGGDSRGAAQLMTVQFSIDSTKPSDTQPIPTRPTAADRIRSYAADVLVASSRRPTWVRVGNRGGKWTGWVQLKP